MSKTDLEQQEIPVILFNRQERDEMKEICEILINHKLAKKRHKANAKKTLELIDSLEAYEKENNIDINVDIDTINNHILNSFRTQGLD